MSAPDEDVRVVMFCHPDSGGSPAALLQECLDRAPAFSSVEIPPGTYVLDRQVVISRPVTLRTAGTDGTGVSCRATPERCAMLVASPDLFEAFGFLMVRRASGVTLEHLVLDGNRAARLSSVAGQYCLRGRNATGFNAAVVDCVGCALDDLVSKNALCGTGMVWAGQQASIRNSDFRNNGDATTRLMWADGLTVVYAPDSEIADNVFVDNSDIGLILGDAARSRVERNVVVQRTQRAFAGLMLHNFSSNRLSDHGDFRGALIASNTVDCASQSCVFGIQVGPSPWNLTGKIVGGELRGNVVRGAMVGINVDGAGHRFAPTAIFANRVVDVPDGAQFARCARPIPTGWMNVSPVSVVDRRDEVVPAGRHLSDTCQLFSEIAAIP